MNEQGSDDDLTAIRKLAERMHITPNPYEHDSESVTRVLARSTSGRRPRRLPWPAVAAVAAAAVAAMVGLSLISPRSDPSRPATTATVPAPASPSSVAPTNPASTPGISDKVPPGLTTLLRRADSVVLVSTEGGGPAGATTAHVREVFKGDLHVGSAIPIDLSKAIRPPARHVLFLNGADLLADFASTSRPDAIFTFVRGTEHLIDELSLEDVRTAATGG